jgi:hypothetical protein
MAWPVRSPPLTLGGVLRLPFGGVISHTPRRTAIQARWGAGLPSVWRERAHAVRMEIETRVGGCPGCSGTATGGAVRGAPGCDAPGRRRCGPRRSVRTGALRELGLHACAGRCHAPPHGIPRWRAHPSCCSSDEERARRSLNTALKTRPLVLRRHVHAARLHGSPGAAGVLPRAPGVCGCVRCAAASQQIRCVHVPSRIVQHTPPSGPPVPALAAAVLTSGAHAGQVQLGEGLTPKGAARVDVCLVGEWVRRC